VPFGEYVDSADALRIGLVDEVVPLDSLDATARALADRAASSSTETLRELKRLLRESPALDDEAYEIALLDAQRRCLQRR
jgi:enoyl-CoA hydratase/carnithine racemase